VRNIRLRIQYDGGKYHGWQRQPQEITIQEVIEGAIKKMTQEDVNLAGSGRTDAGVHALCQVANFQTNSGIPLEGFKKGLNSLLPQDISVLEAVEVHADFHALRDCLGKVYSYYLISAGTRLPIWDHRAWVVERSLDIFKMKTAISCLLGEHDFSAFQAAGSSVKTSVRKVCYADIVDLFYDVYHGSHFLFTIAADGFLRYMVRNIVGTLVEIGTGKRDSGKMQMLLASRDRAQAGRTAPPYGLYLREIFYEEAEIKRFLNNPEEYLKWQKI
jgi:tRNA pseudouridine38-40 synthase